MNKPLFSHLECVCKCTEEDEKWVENGAYLVVFHSRAKMYAYVHLSLCMDEKEELLLQH